MTILQIDIISMNKQLINAVSQSSYKYAETSDCFLFYFMDIHVYNNHIFRQTCETGGERETERHRQTLLVSDNHDVRRTEYYAISSLSNRQVRREENKQIVIFNDWHEFPRTEGNSFRHSRTERGGERKFNKQTEIDIFRYWHEFPWTERNSFRHSRTERRG